MAQIALLVEARLLQPEAVRDVQDRLRVVVESILAFFGRGVGANVDVFAADGDLLAVGFVGDAVDQFEPVRVGDDFVARDNVLVLRSVAWAARRGWGEGKCLVDNHGGGGGGVEDEREKIILEE